jgi:uncharacterized protein YyaL (SSP411 family)
MSEIAWRPWDDSAFAAARAEDKPVLLSIVAPWCQFCRAMDEQTYANDAIAGFVNDNFVAVRVDSDKRPDINARYTQGGWPTTCVLTGEGDVLWGGTSLPAEHMAQLLPQILNSFHNDKNGLNQHVTNLRQQIRQQNTPPPLDRNAPLQPMVAANVLTAAKFEFDFAFGGFGHGGQKFPHCDTVELVMEQYARTVQAGEPDADLKLMLERTLAGIADGDMRDPVDGGFFRYAQTPDWRNPQVEKLLEDNGAIARLFFRASQLLGGERWRKAAEATLAYLDSHLRLDDSGAFGGSQFADAEYYAQPVDERQEWNPPTVDTVVYAGANATAARAFFAGWQATGDTTLRDKAQSTVDYLLANLVESGVVTHHSAVDGVISAAGLLADAADVCAACLDLYEGGCGTHYLDSAEEIAIWVRGHLEDPQGGGLFDHPVSPNSIGNLKIGSKDVNDNMQMADALFRCFLATGETEHAQLAQRILQALQPATPQLGFLGASVALATERAVLTPVLVHVLGERDDARTQTLLAAAHRCYRFERFVQPLDPSDPADREHIENLEYEIPDAPIARTAMGAVPLAPTLDPETLVETVRTATV